MDKIIKRLLLLALLCVPWAAQVNAQCDQGATMCEITFQMTDSYGDGWNGNTIYVYQNTVLRGSVTLSSGSSGQATVNICSGDSVRLEWSGGSGYPYYSEEATFTVLNGDGTTVLSNAAGNDYEEGDDIATFMPVCPNCIKPTELTFSDVDSASATISWTAGAGETSWLITIGSDTYEVSSNTYYASNLNPMTTYNVSVCALCTGGDTSAALTGSFTTACGTMTLPFFTDWENIPYNGAWPDCWTRILQHNTDPSVNYNNNHTPGGTYSMYLQASYDYNMFASGKIPLAGDEIYVSYFAYLNSSSAVIEAGVMTDPYADSTFIPLDSLTNSTVSTYTWLEREFNTSSLDPTQEYYLAFRAYGTSSWSALGYIDDITIAQYTGCSRPATARIDSIGSYDVQLSWDAADGANGYTVYYATVNDINSEDAESSFTTDTVVTISVDPQTTYWAWVITECGNVTAPARNFGSFHTGCADASCDVTVAINASYSYYSPGVTVWQDNYALGSWQSPGSYTVEVCDADTITFTWMAPNYNYGTSSISISDGGNTQVFSTSESHATGDTIFTLADACPSCIPPANFRAVYRSVDSIVVAWDPRSDESEWVLWINDSSIGQVTDTFFVFEELDANTSYTIALQSVCSSDDSSSIISKTFKTTCQVMTIPYTEDFEDAPNGGWPSCWNLILSHGTDPSTNAQRNHTDGGNRAMFLLASNDYNMFSSGVVPLSGDAINVSFWAYMPTYGSPEIVAGVMSNPDDTGSFIPLLFITDATGSWNEYEFNTSTLDGNESYYVAFRFYSTYGYSSYAGAIDDITISEYSQCERPAAAWAESVSEYTATLSWNTVNIATSYYVYYNTVNDFENAQSVQCYDTTITLQNLLPQTTYYAWVLTACASEYSGDSRMVSPFTTLTTCAPVANVALENVSYTAAQVSWDYDLSEGFAPTMVQLTLTDNSDTSVAPIVSYQTGTMATFLNLTSAHNYTVKIRTMCQTDYQIDTAAIVNFSFNTMNCQGPEISSASSSATATSNPLNNYYNYSYAQNLYLASQMPAVDTIYGVAFRASGSSNRTVTVDVYMGNSSMTGLSTSSFESTSNMTLVASNYQLDLSEAGWHNISFNAPFVWDGTSNVVVAIDNNTGSYSSNLYWYTHPTDTTQSVWSYGDGTNYDPTSISSLTYSANNALDIQFIVPCQTPTCVAPMLTINNVDSAGFTANWVGLGEATHHAISLDGTYQLTTTGSTMTFQNMVPNTVHTIGVGAICQNGDTVWSYRTVKTSCGMMTLPYIESFESDNEGEMVSCWNIIHDYTYSTYYGEPTTYPLITTGGMNSDQALTFFGYGPCMAATSAIPNNGLQGDQYHISFYARLATNNCTATAGVMTDPAYDTTYTSLVTISNDNQWHRYDIYTTGLNASDIYHFAVRYDGSASYNSYLLNIDDLNISIDSGCHFASNLTATSTTSSVTLHWDNDGQTANFVVAYHIASATTFSYANAGSADSIVINNLQGASSYLFRVGNICSNGDTLWTEISAITDCGTIYLPYFEDFSAYAQDVMPPCWVYSSTAITHYDGGLFFRSNTGPNYPAVLPQFDQPIDKTEIEFKTKVGPVSQGDAILVGVADANGNFIQWLDTLTDNNQSRSAFVWMTYRFDNYSGTGSRVALGRLYTGGDWALIDDINVRQIPTCSPADNIVGHNLYDPDSSYFTWGNPDSLTDFYVYVDTVTTDTSAIPLSTLTPVSAYSYLIPSGILSGGGKYKFFISTACGNNHSTWTVVTFGSGEFIMSQSGTDTVTSCGLVVYDNGGPIAGYYSQTSSSLVMYPSDNSSRLQIYGAYLSLYNDGSSTLTIYDGAGTSGTVLYQTSYSGPTTMYDSIVSLPLATSSNGPLTVSFSAGTYVNPGYELYVRCIPIVSCDDPTYIQTNSITANEASLGWYGNATDYNVYYRQYGSSNWNMVSTTTPNVTLTGLANATTYEVQIRAICSATDSSNLSSIFTFTTECDVVNITPSTPLVEEFEGNQVPPTCWQLVYGATANATDNPVIFDASAAYSGTKGLRFSSATMTASGNYNQTIITPELNSDSAMAVLFYVKASESTEMFRVGYSTTNDNAGSFTWQAPLTVGTTWMLYRQDIPAAAKYVAINYMSGAPRHYLYVDSLVIAVNDGTIDCAAPVISSTSSTTSTISVSYMSFGTVEAGIVAGDTWDGSTTVQTLPEGNSYTFNHLFSDNSALLDATTYTIGLRAVCGNDYSDWVTTTISTLALECNAPTNVTVNVIDGGSASVSWDANGASSWEVNYSTGSNEQTLNATTNSITLSGLTEGATYTVKVRAICGQSQSDWSPTVTFTPSSCNVPTGLGTSEITQSSAKLTWSAGNATTWEIAYGFTSSFDVSSATHVNANTNEFTLTGLTNNSQYTWAVRAICENGTSGWSGHVNFTTLPSEQGIDNADNASIAIYPNPTTDATNITVSGISGEVSIAIVDLNGRTVATESMMCDGNCSKTIQVNNLAKGAYFVRIAGNDGINMVKKLIVK